MNKIVQQDMLQLFPESKTNWLDEMLEKLSINSGPAWQDKLGQSLGQWFDKNKLQKVKTLSLFTGAGGLDIGFHDANFDIIEMVEIEERFVKSLRANQKDSLSGVSIKCMDIRKYHPDPKLKVDFIIGGPPCQTFSAAGRRASGVQGINDPRGVLFQEYVRLLKTLKPKAFLFENVYGIVGAQGGKAWNAIQEGFKEAGYQIFFRILDAADYGVPQHRERLIIVGIHDPEKEFLFPFPTHGPDSPNHAPHYSAGEAVKNTKTSEPLKPVNGKYGKLLDNIPPGLNYSYYTKEMGYPNPIFAWRSKFSDFLYKADPDKPARAIKAQGGQYTGPFSWNNRFFTTSELKRLQTFPDSYDLVGNRNVVIHQIGNSVPPQFARVLALSVLNQVFKRKLPYQIQYMPSRFQLSFRTRKRALTNEYRGKALNATNGNRHGNEQKAKQDAQPFIDQKIIRYINPQNLTWSTKEKSGFIRILITHSLINNVWIVGASSKGKTKKQVYKITITPAGKLWSLPYERVELVAYDNEKITLTALWKAFEEQLNVKSGYADVVQLAGYYQYKPKIMTNMTISNDLEKDVFWKTVNLVINNQIPSKLVALEELHSALECESEILMDALTEMKKFGFEIRNKKTNPQIKDNYYLIPYTFPTLNPRSVQLYKSLT